MSTTRKVAEYVVEAQFPTIPEDAAKEVKNSILDGIGTSLESSAMPIGEIVKGLTEDLGGRPSARLLGSGVRTSVADAAFANGMLTHGYDHDDIGPGFGHTACILMPVALALGEEHHLSGRQVTEAFLVGYEVGARIGYAMGPDHYERGWHATSTFGTMGGTATACRLLGLDVQQTRHALGIAASTASGIRANFGYMAKPYHPGNAARAAVVSALLAQRGLTANPDVLEARFGYFAAFGDDKAELGHVTRHLGNPLAITAGIVIKPWPCCGGIHPALTALDEMLAERPVNPQDIESVEVVIPQEPLNIAPGIWDPETGFQGKFSLWYGVAARLLDGKIDQDSFTDEAVMRKEAQEMMKRVRVEQDPYFKGKPSRAIEPSRAATITLHLRGGSDYAWHAEKARSLQGYEVVAKYRANALSAGLSPGSVERSTSLVQGLESLSDVTELVDSLIVANGD